MIKKGTRSTESNTFAEPSAMTRHTLAERLLIVLAVCGALTIISLIGTRFVPPGAVGISFSVGGVTVVLFTVLIVTLVVIGLALVYALRSRR
jgi:hypothetical protein